MSVPGGLAMIRAVLVSLLSLLVAGAPAVHARGPVPETTLDLGVLITMSPTGDPDTQAAIRLAIDDLNAFLAFRYPPSRVRLTVEGTGLDPDVAREKIAELAARGLNVVVGPESSAEVEAIKPFTDAHGMVLLSHCSTAPALAIPGDNVYRMVPSDLRQAAVLARLFAEHGKRVLVPVWRADVWGDGISAGTRDRFVALGGTVSAGVRFDPDAADFTADLAAVADQVERARALEGDAVAVAFFGFGTEAAPFLARAADFPALATVAWYGSDGTALSREITDDPRAARFAIRTGFLNTLFADARTRRAGGVRRRISAAIGGGSVYFCAPAAYDAVWLAGLSAAAVGTADVDAFKRALVEIAGVYTGASGPTAFDPAGDRAEAAYDVWAIEETAGQFLWKPVSRGIGAD